MIARAAVLVFATMLASPLHAAEASYAKAEQLLQHGLESRNPDTRKVAVAALSLAASREPFRTRLRSMLSDKDAEVRLAALAGLSEVKHPAVATELRKMLDDEVPEVSFAAAKALWSLNDPSGKRALMAVVGGESKASSGYLSRQKREALRMMHTPRTALLFAARQSAGFAPIPGLGGGISSMQAILTDPEVSGRAAAALLLAQRADPATLQAFREALTQKDSSLRAAAVHALALTNSRKFRNDVAPLMDDEKEAVRLRAAAAYIRLSPAPRARAVSAKGAE
ncbi:MAG TPA: HEAT repeat domain-containing protein [Bryobacteraceae bacterium]|nr:HEAT repeat domain-containing protein [Bryobacteraceae bacterium]